MERWKRVAATVVALLTAVCAVAVFVGYAIYRVADVGGNLASIGSFLKAIHDAGTVNLGAVILLALGLFGIGALVMALWGLGPFRSVDGHSRGIPVEGDLTIHRAAWGHSETESFDVTDKIRASAGRTSIDIPVATAVLGDPFPGNGKYLTVLYSVVEKAVVAEQPVPLRLALPSVRAATTTSVSTPLGPMEASGIGIFRSISFRYVSHGDESLFHCACVVDFFGLRDVNASPLKLRLTTVGGTDELATLEPIGSARLKCPVNLTYEGRGSWKALMDVAEKTMWTDRPRTRPMPWSTTPIGDSVYCNVEIRLPGIEQSEKHRDSLIKLSFELARHDHKSIMVRIDPWTTLAPPTTSTTLL